MRFPKSVLRALGVSRHPRVRRRAQVYLLFPNLKVYNIFSIHGAIHCATSGSVLPARARFVACGMPDDMRLSESLFVNSSYASLQ